MAFRSSSSNLANVYPLLDYLIIKESVPNKE